MQRLINFFRMNANTARSTRTAMMILVILAAYAGMNVTRTFAQMPPASEQSGMESTNMDAATMDAMEGAMDGEEAKADDAAAVPVQDESLLISLKQWHAAGDFWMYFLDIAVIITLMIFLERTYYYTVTKITNKRFQQNIEDAIKTDSMEGVRRVIEENNNYKIANILAESIEVGKSDPDNFSRSVEREAAAVLNRAERGLSILAAVSTIAPLIGFLGTVAGMYSAFDSIANADSVNAKVVAGGIKVALVTTMYGLIAAIPAMASFQAFNNIVNGYATSIEQAANAVYKELVRLSGTSNT